MSMATCADCGDTIRYNKAIMKNGQPMKYAKPGWYHWPKSGKRDHLPTPADGRDPEAEVTRERSVIDQARAGVRDSLQRSFDHLHAEKTVNEIFKDRR